MRFIWTASARRPEPLPEPTLAQLAGNFTAALARWIGSGLAVVSEAQYAARAAVCDACLDHSGNPLWNAQARGGLGRCEVCKCTAMKRWLPAEQCPLGKWPSLKTNH